MAGNEFKEWPDMHTPGGTHGARVTKTYDFPLTEEDRLAGEGLPEDFRLVLSGVLWRK